MPLMEVRKLFSGKAPEGSFEDQYSDTRWLNRASAFRRTCGNYCQSCRQAGIVIHVHHVNYDRTKKLWEHDDEDLALLCEGCHSLIHTTIKVYRRIAGHSNAKNIAAITGLLHQLIQKHGDTQAALKIASLLQ